MRKSPISATFYFLFASMSVIAHSTVLVAFLRSNHVMNVYTNDTTLGCETLQNNKKGQRFTQFRLNCLQILVYQDVQILNIPTDEKDKVIFMCWQTEAKC